MTSNPAEEPRIDLDLADYMESRALEIARDKAGGTALRQAITALIDLREALLQHRRAYRDEATRKRHARGEIYSAARVAAINAMAGDRASMDKDIRRLYEREPDAIGVLKAHAQTHFVYALVSSRLLLASHTADIIDSARVMQQREEAFAAAWVGAIGDARFETDLREAKRVMLHSLRTSTRPMLLATYPAPQELGDDAAQVLGKAWNKLDDLANALGVMPLSSFISLPDEDVAAAVSATQILASVDTLLRGVQDVAVKLPSKRAVASALSDVRQVLLAALETDALAKAMFMVDT